MKCVIKLNVIFATFLWGNVIAQEPCFLNLNGDKAPLFRPFIFDDNGKLHQSLNNIVKVISGKSVTLKCESNYFRNYPRKSELVVRCQDDNLYVAGGEIKPVTFKELSCDLRLIEEVRHDVNDCSSKYQGISYQYLDAKTGTYNHLAEVCYDNKLLRNVFTHISLSENNNFLGYGSHNDSALQSNTNIVHRIGVMSAYRVDKVKASLDKALGENFARADETIGVVKLPPLSFFNDQFQDVQKFPANYVGVWSSIRDGNWKRIISDIHKYSRDKSLDVYFGTHDVLALPSDKTDRNENLYLDGDKHPIPKYLWTVVHSKQKQASVVIYTVNNPFIAESELNDVVLCNNICNQIKWLSDLVKNKNNERSIYGYTFCCKFDTLPYLESIKGATKKVLN